MNKMDSVSLARALSDAPGASGFEDAVVAAIRPHVESLGDVQEDKLRNLYCFRRGSQPGRPTV